MKDCCPTTHFKIHDPAAHHDIDTQKYRYCLVKKTKQMNYNKEKNEGL